MEGVRTFLESSTVHGLSYISTTRRYARIFWIFVVMAGFVGASLLIKASFDSWSESPVKTTVETLPINRLKLPKITVCPPRNTFTDLNYDLMMTENVTLTEEMRNEMFKYAIEIINADTVDSLQEEDRFYNWYYGYTTFTALIDKFGFPKSDIETSDTSGVISTLYYGQQFMSELVEKQLYYSVSVFPPESVQNNDNVTLHLSVEKVSMTELLRDNEDTINFSWGDTLDTDQTTAYENYRPPGLGATVQLTRYVSSEDVDSQKLNVMPGFRLRCWWYTGAEVSK